MNSTQNEATWGGKIQAAEGFPVAIQMRGKDTLASRSKRIRAKTSRTPMSSVTG